MPTRIIEKLNQIELANLRPVFVVHPIEGHVNMLKSWAKHMKFPVYGIQWTQDASQFENMEQLAHFYWLQVENQLMKDSTSIKRPLIHLCGYSFGASVAFEMAIQRTDQIASLSLLDGSHSYVSSQINSYKAKFNLGNNAETETEALFTFAQQYAPIRSRKEFLDQMLALSSFDERIVKCVNEIMSNSMFSFDKTDLSHATRAFVNRLFMSNR